ncbi:MAG: Rieske 2Fe-2S domain-containing protein [Actinomycetota bacterium]
MDDLERQKLRHAWFPVATTRDVRIGVLTSARLLDTRLVVTRTESKVVVAQSDCPHRGADIGLGNVVGKTFECPYHGWRYDFDGTCVDVPSLPDGVGHPTARLGILNSLEKYGHIWVSLDDPELPMPHIDVLETGEWHVTAGKPRDVACGLRQITENFRDISHFAFVHQGTMGPDVPRVVPPYRVEQHGSRLTWTIKTEYGAADILRESVITDYSIHLPSIAYVNSRLDKGRRFNGQFVAPLGADAVRHFYLVGIDTEAVQSGISLEEYAALQARIYQEDIPIVESQLPKEAPLDLHGQNHTRADKFSLAYRRLYAEWLTMQDQIWHGLRDRELRKAR